MWEDLDDNDGGDDDDDDDDDDLLTWMKDLFSLNLSFTKAHFSRQC